MNSEDKLMAIIAVLLFGGMLTLALVAILTPGEAERENACMVQLCQNATTADRAQCLETAKAACKESR